MPPAAMTLMLKRCTRCGIVKPWSEFSPQDRSPDGTVRTVQPRCKQCRREWQRAHRDKAKHAAAERARRNDPERGAIISAQRRDCDRRRRGIPPDRWHGPRKPRAREGYGEKLDAEPFARWLRTAIAQYDLTPIKAAHRYGIDPANLRRLLNGRKTYVSLSTVDHALSRSNTDLWELYDPETLAPLPRSTT